MNFAKLGVMLLFLLVSGAALAQDVTGAVTAIGAAIVPIGLIGGAVLLVLVAAKIYKWVRRAM